MRYSKQFPFLKTGSSKAEADEPQPAILGSPLEQSPPSSQRQIAEKVASLQLVGNPGCLNESEDKPARFGLKVLIPQPSTKGHCVDIIAIHGLNGHYQGTWADRTTGANWLIDREFLANDIPNARIQSFGYNSISYFSKSNANVQDFASELLAAIKSSRRTALEKKRPIVFICHSLGGIVFKQAVVRAHEQNEYYADILDNIQGVAFFGTPHRGSDLAFWDYIGATLVRSVTLGYSTNKTLSKELKIDSEMLKRVSESFAYRGAKMKIRSFYETESMKGLNCRVVERDSSILGWSSEIDIAASANHSSICKFPRADDSRYRIACYSIGEMIDGESELTVIESDLTLTQREQSCLREFDVDYESQLSEVDDPVPGTCLWILCHEEWLKWDSIQTSSLLWITADAGCGKSVIAKHLINYYKGQSAHKKRNICYFFFKDGFENQDNAQSALSAILHQIFCFQPVLLKHALAKCSTTPKRIFKQFACLHSILMRTLEDEAFQDTLCIIDGLDECETKSRDLLVKALSAYFTEHVSWTSKDQEPFKMIILSRPDNKIEQGLQIHNKNVTDKIRMSVGSPLKAKCHLMGEDEAAAIAKDVNIFVRARIEDFGPKSELSEDVLASVEDKLIHGADFTFLWVSLVIKLLEDAEADGLSREQLESILQTNDLNDVYNRLLSARKHPLKTRKALYIILAAARPLTLEEMSVALEVHQDYDLPTSQDSSSKERISRFKLTPADIRSADPSKSHNRVTGLRLLSRKLYKPFTNHLRLLCGHFVRIRANKIYLVHQTARKFLLDSRVDNDFSLGYYLRPFGWNIDKPNSAERKDFEEKISYVHDLEKWEHTIRLDVATRYLLQVCIDYISLFDNIGEERSRTFMKAGQYLKKYAHRPEHAFLKYVSAYWVEHYRGLRLGLRECFDDLFDPANPRFTIWAPNHDIPMPGRKEQIKTATGKSIRSSEAHVESSGQLSVMVNAPISREWHHRYDREEEIQHVLDHFNLGGIDTELFDKEYLEGDHYWKSPLLKTAVDYEDDENEETVQEHNAATTVIPDRVQYFRRQYRNRIQQLNRESLDPLSPGSMNPTSIKTHVFDSFFDEKSWKTQNAASVQKGFGTQKLQHRSPIAGGEYERPWKLFQEEEIVSQKAVAEEDEYMRELAIQSAGEDTE
ncbi:hypothetical protein EG329_011454 [Mollisiaceae sp. DMI_Dod_QoI]|nr:hypothetical protein EG329_011454 [Helotiales sp. DMI_Dod_QoI]